MQSRPKLKMPPRQIPEFLGGYPMKTMGTIRPVDARASSKIERRGERLPLARQGINREPTADVRKIG